MLGWRASWEKDSTVASLGDSPPPPLRDASRCVILSRGDDISPGFLASLTQRGVETVIIGRPIVAFAELLVMERERGPSSGWGLPERNRTLFIVADRERWEQLDQLLTAIRTHLPRVAVWVAAADLLMDVTEAPRGRGGDDRPGEGPQGEDDILAGLPRLRLTGSEADLAAASSTQPTAPVAPSPADSGHAGSGGPERDDLDADLDADPEADATSSTASSVGDLGPDGDDDPRFLSSSPNSAAVTPEEIEMLLRVLPPPPPKGQDPLDPSRPEGSR